MNRTKSYTNLREQKFYKAALDVFKTMNGIVRHASDNTSILELHLAKNIHQQLCARIVTSSISLLETIALSSTSKKPLKGKSLFHLIETRIFELIAIHNILKKKEYVKPELAQLVDEELYKLKTIFYQSFSPLEKK